ncbi:uncharacterized protein MONBRDRAFT_37610 [Monosiga brevicollis MX1]|uniref:RRM domain-containing protein n=1 Tax=Monosiga brevicollis TaxID=81824 RepID=A9V2T3_MONBE|nr:uncharacterized protein MONBRDRAFT_37610 [Monosiga brevicollis MX1]EDQ88068.1 predicted protein [Monosiga brevicollis MX1]|eukprot:XP_001747144.1 hypothetical protein [Monosiga brevicollis MX1]
MSLFWIGNVARVRSAPIALHEAFRVYGQVESIVLVKRIGFVKFTATVDEEAVCAALRDRVINDSPLQISVDSSQRTQQDRLRNGPVAVVVANVDPAVTIDEMRAFCENFKVLEANSIRGPPVAEGEAKSAPDFHHYILIFPGSMKAAEAAAHLRAQPQLSAAASFLYMGPELEVMVRSAQHLHLLPANMIVSHSQAGAIIGQGGANIRELQAKTSTNIRVQSQSGDMGQDRIVTIQGSSSQLVAACMNILHLMQANDLAERGSGQQGNPPMLQFSIPEAIVGRIIGKSGRTIRHIQDVSGAFARVVNQAYPALEPAQRILQLSGTNSQLKRALQMCVRYFTVTAGDDVNISSAAGRLERTQITIPAVFMGSVIGRQGAHIKRLRQSSSAEVDLSEAREDGSAIMTISGPTAEQVKLHQYIFGHMKTHAEATEGCELPVFHVQMDVPKAAVSAIIGRQGGNIKDIQRTYDVKMEVDDAERVGSVVLDGTFASVQAALTRVRMLVDESMAAKH